MQPGILHNDTLVVALDRAPGEGSIVVVTTDRPHPVYGPLLGCVWRYHRRGTRAFLRKDNPRYPQQPRVTREQIIGVVTRVLPRTVRDPNEHHEVIALDRALFGACKYTPRTEPGFFEAAHATRFRAVVSIPAGELRDGRLPWGLFRATVLADHAHAGIAAGDVLTIDPTSERRTGNLAITRIGEETVIGVIAREAGAAQANEFYMDLGSRRVFLTRHNGRRPTSVTIGVIRCTAPAARPTAQVAVTVGAGARPGRG
jgi:hypothetical protein